MFVIISLIVLVGISILTTGCLNGNGDDDETLVEGINSVSPEEGENEVSVTTDIVIEFDREVDHRTAEIFFVIDPETDGDFSWQGNKMTYTPSSDLMPGVTYTCLITKSVKDVDGNKFLEEDYRWQFNT